MIFAKVSGAGVWTDGTLRETLTLLVDANNKVLLEKSSGNNTFSFRYAAGGTEESVSKSSHNPTGWGMYAMTWDKAGSGNMTAYYNGAQEGTPQAIAGTWAGSLAATNTLIGAYHTTPLFAWDGSLAHGALWAGKALTAAQILNIYNQSGIA